MKFEALNLISPILRALTEQGYSAPTPIQEGAIPPALEGRDVLGLAQTGTGKTCAFAVPILQRLNENPDPAHPVRALILTPTRELALQIQENIEAYGKHLNLRSIVIFGGVSQVPQAAALKHGTDILVATPGRLLDLHNQGLIDTDRLEVLVLDEADRMLDMGFIHDVKKILSWLPKKKQTLFFSATMPKEITELVNSLLRNPARVQVDPVSSPVERIRQQVYFVDKNNKTALLAQILRQEQVSSALVFTRTKHGANKVAGDLTKRGISAAAIHGNKSQTARQNALSGFKDGSIRVLVATDIAARGIDIEELPYVFNYNLPEVPETYVHRIGRTGRAGHEGVAVSFCDFGEKPLLKDVEKLIGRSVPVVEEHDFPMVVLEAPKKDKHGRVVNEEDQEARAAAKKRRQERDAANKAAAEERKKKANRAAAGLEPEEEKRSSGKRSRNRKKKEPQEPMIPAAKPKKAERTYSRPVRSGTLEDYLKDTEVTEYDYSEFPLLAQMQKGLDDSDRVMDATARLLSGTGSRFRTAADREPEPDRREGKGRKDSRSRKKSGAKAQKAEPVSRKPAPKMEGSMGKKKPLPKQDGAKDGRLIHMDGKKKGKRRRESTPPPLSRSLHASQKDSTEQKSLMKPYYITKD